MNRDHLEGDGPSPDELVNRLFELGLEMNRLLPLTAETAAAQPFKQAVTNIDDAIDAVRSAAWVARHADGAPSSRAGEPTLRVVCVDDEEDIRVLMGEVLQEIGRVQSCADVYEALDHLRAHGADVLVLDARFPGASGAELLTRLGDLGMRVPTVVLTGLTSGPLLDALAGHDNVRAIMAKPFEARRLRATVTAAAVAS